MMSADWLDNRDPEAIESGFCCAECLEPFADSTGSPRLCPACTSADASREEDMAQAEPPGCHDSLRMEFEP